MWLKTNLLFGISLWPSAPRGCTDHQYWGCTPACELACSCSVNTVWVGTSGVCGSGSLGLDLYVLDYTEEWMQVQFPQQGYIAIKIGFCCVSKFNCMLVEWIYSSFVKSWLGIIIAQYQARLKTDMKLYWFRTLLGFFLMYVWHSWFQYVLLSGPNAPLSSGWVRWVVLGGNQKTITFSCAALLKTLGCIKGEEQGPLWRCMD